MQILSHILLLLARVIGTQSGFHLLLDSTSQYAQYPSRSTFILECYKFCNGRTFTLRSLITLGVVQSMGFDKWIMIHIHHHSIIWNSFTALKVLCTPFILLYSYTLYWLWSLFLNITWLEVSGNTVFSDFLCSFPKCT